MKIQWYCIWLFLLISFRLGAQPYYFTQYQVEQGLSNNTVLCGIQDHRGFLWFGTKDGLNRFDGYSFKTYRLDPDNSGELNSNFIRALLEDDTGQIWAGTDQGIYLFNPQNEKFRLFRATITGETLAIKKDRDGSIWFISNLNLYHYDLKSDSLQQIRNVDDGPVQNTALCITADKNVWVAGMNGKLYHFKPQTNTYAGYQLFDHSKPVISHWIEKIIDARNGYLLIGTGKQGLKKFDTKTGTYTDLISHDQAGADLFVRDIIERKPNEFWIASESGIYIYHADKGNFTNLRKQYNNPWALSDNAVYNLCPDNEGGLWIGTYFGGINYYTDQHRFFEKFFPIPDQNAISGNAVREICKDHNGHLWIGTEDGGLNKLDVQQGLFSNLKATGKKGAISSNNIHGLIAIGDTLWVGTFEHGLDWVNIHSGQVIRHFEAMEEDGHLHNNFILNILKTRTGQVLLATGRGIYRYKPENETFNLDPDFPNYIFYTTLYEDSFGTIWAGTWRDGLFFSNPQLKKNGSYRRNGKQKHGLSNNRVTHIFEDSRQNLWIATEGGLCRYSYQTEKIESLINGLALPSNLILDMLEDNSRHLWITTSKGLVRYDPEKGESTTFTIANGLLSDQFNYNSGFKDSNGDLYFGSVKGLIRFNPKNLKDNSFRPPVFITGFQVNNKELAIGQKDSPLKKSISFTDSLVLHYDQSTMSIDFSALGFSSPKTLGYAYKMEGLDEAWTPVADGRKAIFTKLAPGEYYFRVNAVNSDGSPKGLERRLYIRVDPPFWASIPAYLCYLLLFTALIAYIVRNYHYRIKQKNKRKLDTMRHKKEEELYQAKMEFFTNIAHEIKTPLTLIKAPLESLVRRTKEQPQLQKQLFTMERNTERLIELTGQLLDFRRTEVQGFSLHFEETDLKKLIEDNYSRFKPATAEKKMSFQIHLPAAPLMVMADAEALHKILSNLLNNALKYADKKIVVVAGLTDSTCTIQVKSDGYLIPYELREKIFETFYRLKRTENKTGTGLGLTLSRTLAELHNGTLTLSPAEADLNVFTLVLPIRQNKHPNPNTLTNL
ncbi:Signal transduction histidine kinase [bacterium A37T11]|nr:Signal transduction histidine kinase [bacterium A37T11]